jgi:hypothetical protein
VTDLYGAPDVAAGDQVLMYEGRLMIHKADGETVVHLCWRDLSDYAAWIKRNRSHLPEEWFDMADMVQRFLTAKDN